MDEPEQSQADEPDEEAQEEDKMSVKSDQIEEMEFD